MLASIVLAAGILAEPIVRSCAYFTSRETGVIAVDEFGGDKIDQLAPSKRTWILLRDSRDLSVFRKLLQEHHVLLRAASFEQSSPRTFYMEGLSVVHIEHDPATRYSREQDYVSLSVARWLPRDADAAPLPSELRPIAAAVQRDRKLYAIEC